MIFMAGGNAYSLYYEHKNGWNPEAFRERFSEVLERFDYIVGDWGYNQLRLRGFYRDGHPRATKENTLSSLVDYINEYCNFGCAYFVVTKLDQSALPPDAVIMKEDEITPEVLAAWNETDEQAAETAAAAAPLISPVIINGQLMRWPIKERLGGPARAPNVTVSALARAAADAERRNASANAAQAPTAAQARGSYPKQGQDQGNPASANRPGKNNSSGGERRQQAQGQGAFSGKPNPPRRPRPQGNEQTRPSGHESRHSEEGSVLGEHQENSRGEATRSDNRWSSKNRRRKSFGGKPNPRSDGSARTDSGKPRSSE